MRTARDGALALRDALDAEGGTVAGVLADPGLDPDRDSDRDRAPDRDRDRAPDRDPDRDPDHDLDRDPSPDRGALDRPGPAQIAATGPRTRGRERDYEVLLEMILEGYRLHYGRPLVVSPDDEDLALLLGDQLYALGLARLAALGDMDAVAELADVISLVAQAHSAADPDLAQAVWEAGATSVGWGPSEAHRLAKQRARAHEAGARQALRDAAAALRDGAV